jgi:hypothetical protein
MPLPDDGHFRLTAPDGSIIARGSLSALMERVNQSVPRMNAEQAIAAAAKAIQRERDDKVRADSLDRREAEIKAREDAARAADLRRFVDGVSALTARMDALEQERNQRTLDALPDPDSPQADDLEAVLEAPGPKHREREQELAEAEEAIGSKDDELELKHAEPDDQDLGVPAASLSPIMGKPFEGNELPEGTPFPVKHDSFGLLGQRARKLARRRMQI